MQRVALMYFIWVATESSFWLGVFAALDMLPVILIGPYAGVLADRLDKRKMLLLCQFGSLAITLGYLVSHLTAVFDLPLLLGLTLVQGCLVGISQPARMAFVQSMVEQDDVGTAVALGSVTINITRLVGPAIGGWMLAIGQTGLIFFCNFLMTLVFVSVLASIPARHTPKPRKLGTYAMLKEGLVYTFTDPGMRTVVLLMVVTGTTIRAMPELFPAFAARLFGSDPQSLSLLLSCLACGSIVAGIYLSVAHSERHLLRQIFVSGCVGALSVLSLAADIPAWAAVVACFIIGVALSIGLISTQTYVQLSSPPELRGRTLSVQGLVSRASPAVGALILGAAIDVWGFTWPVTAAAVLAGGASVLAFTQHRNGAGA